MFGSLPKCADVDMLVIADQDLGPCVTDDVGEFLDRQSGIECVEYCSSGWHAEMRLESYVGVWYEHGDTIAGCDARGGESAGQSSAPIPKFGVGQAERTVDHCETLTVGPGRTLEIGKRSQALGAERRLGVQG